VISQQRLSVFSKILLQLLLKARKLHKEVCLHLITNHNLVTISKIIPKWNMGRKPWYQLQQLSITIPISSTCENGSTFPTTEISVFWHPLDKNRSDATNINQAQTFHQNSALKWKLHNYNTGSQIHIIRFSSPHL